MLRTSELDMVTPLRAMRSGDAGSEVGKLFNADAIGSRTACLFYAEMPPA
jgi:hypothetical protein